MGEYVPPRSLGEHHNRRHEGGLLLKQYVKGLQEVGFLDRLDFRDALDGNAILQSLAEARLDPPRLVETEPVEKGEARYADVGL